MRYQLFGRSGLRVSELCLGTMTFGAGKVGTPESEAGEMYKLFRDAGGNFFDTANEMYADGRSEEILGRLVAGHRHEAVIATKYTFHVPGSNNPNAGGNHRKSLVRSLEGSLKRLNTDYIDMLWTHCWDGVTPVEEVMRALDDLVAQGKVLYIGVSNTPAWVISRSNMLAELRGWTSFIGMQVEYNLIERDVERELLPMAQALNLGVAAWSPLASGILSGKYGNPSSSESKRLDTWPLKQLNDGHLEIAHGVSALAAEIGIHSVQVALSWLRAKPGVIPLIGARTLSQLRDNLTCVEVDLTPEQVARLDALSAIDPGYPHNFMRRVKGLLYTDFQNQPRPDH